MTLSECHERSPCLLFLKNHSLVVDDLPAKAFLVVSFTEKLGSKSKIPIQQKTRYEFAHNESSGKTGMWVFKIGEGKIPQLTPFLNSVNIIQSTVVVRDLLKIRRCHSQNMLFPKGEPGAWEKFLCNGSNVFIPAFLRLQTDGLK